MWLVHIRGTRRVTLKRGLPLISIPSLSEKTFNGFRELIYQETGISMRESKIVLVSNRLRKRVFTLNLSSYEDYYLYLTETKEGKKELPYFIDAISTNETYFFRGDNQFDVLQRVILPELFKKRSKLRVWSAGASTGEEPYSISIIIHETAKGRWSGNVEIIATDISNEVIEKAREGVYSGRTLRFVPREIRGRYFESVGNESYRVGEKARKGISFRTHNLLVDNPPGKSFDIIFCRNVMIYFDKPTQRYLVDQNFASSIAPDGYLFIGHAESLIGTSKKFGYVKILKSPIYTKVKNRHGEEE